MRWVELARKALIVDCFLTSVNAMSETGEMINIDGTGRHRESATQLLSSYYGFVNSGGQER